MKTTSDITYPRTSLSAAPYLTPSIKRTARHISGQELVAGALAYALEQFGPLAPDVLEDWGIAEGRDIGNIVYNMIQVELLSASPEDSRSDFNCYPDIPGFLRRKLDEESRNIPSVKPPIIA